MTAPAQRSLVDLVAEAKRMGNVGILIERVPYARWMGITADVSTGELLTRLVFSDMLIGNPSLPALHGGTLGALLEMAAIFQLLWNAETTALPKTINLTVEYLRSGRPVDTIAKGTITRHGKRVAHVRMEAWQEDRQQPIALGHAHFLILPDVEIGDTSSSGTNFGKPEDGLESD